MRQAVDPIDPTVANLMRNDADKLEIVADITTTKTGGEYENLR